MADQEESKGEVIEAFTEIHLNVTFEFKTGVVKVAGHIDNTDLCMKILIEAAHIILARNSEKDKLRLQQQQQHLKEIANAVKQNGQNENASPAAIN